jgi:hypothetical protein
LFATVSSFRLFGDAALCAQPPGHRGRPLQTGPSAGLAF